MMLNNAQSTKGSKRDVRKYNGKLLLELVDVLRLTK